MDTGAKYITIITQTFPCIIQRFLKAVKMLIFLYFLFQNINCGYTLEPPQ